MSKARKLVSFGKTPPKGSKAILYCRVSSDRQKVEGHGLDSQEHRCREYAGRKGYEVEAVFKDSFSGGGDYMRRPQLSEMLSYISKNAHKEYVVIFDDLKRLARDTISHWKLREHLNNLGATVESPNFEFKEDDDSAWMHEAINAVFNENERRTNRRQVIQKQKARLESGYWAFGAKKGFKMVKHPVHGMLLTPKEPEAYHLRVALEGLADGSFHRLVDCCRYLVENGFWSGQKPERYIDKFKDIAIDVIYAGYIEYPQWEVDLRKGHHEPIVSFEVYETNKRRLTAESKGKRIRVDTSSDFPIRGLTVCASCNRPLTAAWSKGRTKKYAYYFCQNTNCDQYRKNIRKENIENDFMELLKKQTLKDSSIKILELAFDSAWQTKMEEAKVSESKTVERIEELEKVITGLTDSVIKSKSETVREVYEKKIEEVAEELQSLKQKPLLSQEDLSVPYRTALELASGLLKSPYKVWTSLDVFEQQKLFYFIFDERLSYSKTTGYRTDNLSLAKRLFEEFSEENSLDVEMGGVEPPSENGHKHESSMRSSVLDLNMMIEN